MVTLTKPASCLLEHQTSLILVDFIHLSTKQKGGFSHNFMIAVAFDYLTKEILCEFETYTYKI